MILVYVNWNEEEILSAQQYDKMVEEKIEEMANDVGEFESWLDDNYCASEIYSMDFDRLQSLFFDHVREEVTSDLEDDWEAKSIEI